MKKLIAASAFALMVPTVAFAEDLNGIFKKVNDYTAAKNYPKALEELGWARKEIEKLHTDRLKSLFPANVAGYTGGEVESNSALGFSNVERTYKKGDAEVKVSLTGGSGGAGNPLGGLAGLGQMAAMMGGVPGQESVRIAGRTAQVTANREGNSADITVFLESGSMLRFERTDSADTAELKAMAEAFKLDELDGYLKGAAAAPAA